MFHWLANSIIFISTFIFLTLYFSCKPKKAQPVENMKIAPTQDSIPNFSSVELHNPFFNKKLDPSYTKPLTEKLKILFNHYWYKNNVSGGIIVAKNGEILLEKYLGYANQETKDTIDAKTSIHIASISKVLTAMVVMKLVEVDSLKLSDVFDQYFPVFPYPNITIENLLNHRTGLPNYAYFLTEKDLNGKKFATNQDVLNFMTQNTPEAYNLPGKHFSYSNTNYALLALLIEKITNLSYPKAMKKILFEPLKMNHTFVFNIKDSVNVSQSYTYYNRLWEFNYLDQVYGDKNIYSTPKDLLKFDLAIYSNQFLPQNLKDKIFKGYSYETVGVKNYGLGIRLLEWEKDKTLFYHNGWWHGNYTTFVHADRDTVSIIALGNRKTRSVYSAFNFVSVFGDYPVSLDEFQQENLPTSEGNDSLKSFEQKKPLTNEKNDSLDSIKILILKNKIDIQKPNKDEVEKKETVDTLLIEETDSILLN